MLTAKKNVLVLSPHTDDAEIGCGGTISYLIERGKQVSVAVFSFCEESIPDGFPQNILSKEMASSMNTLGVQEKNIIPYEYNVRHFPEHRQDILDNLIALRNSIQPDLIIMPSIQDIHQDHQVIAQEGLRAFKYTSLLGYDMPWNTFRQDHTFFVPLHEKHLENKLRALNYYQSQKQRPYMTRDAIMGLAKMRGLQINNEFAEAFHVIRWIT